MISSLLRRLANPANLNVLISNAQRPISVSTALPTINVKTPTNRAKKFAPTTVPVTKANAHLEIHLFDEKDADLGKVKMSEAKRLAERGELKLAITDESCSPPKFKLMTGAELFKLQMKTKESDAANPVKNLREKEVDFNLGISDHDFDIKMKMVANFYERGHAVKLKVISRIENKAVRLAAFFLQFQYFLD
jgi:translation initiation factor IF-3